MEPWPAPYQNSNDNWCFTYDQKTSGSNFLQTSILFTVSTVLHQTTLQGRVNADEYEVLLPMSSNVTCFVRWRINRSYQRCIFTPVNRQKQIPTLLHIIIYVIKTGFTSCHSPLYNTKRKFYTSWMKENGTVQCNFHIYLGSQVLQHLTSLYYKQRKIIKTYATCAK